MSGNDTDNTHREPATTPGFSPDRRIFVKRAAAIAGAASIPGAVFSQSEPDRSALEVPPWTRQQGSPILTPAYGKPSPFEDHVVRRPTDLTPTRISSWSFTPLQDLHGSVTPNGLVFERHHGGVPEIDPPSSSA